MALWKPFRGSRADLDAVAKHDGYVYFCVDDGSLHFDYTDADGVLQRKQINAKEAESLVGFNPNDYQAKSDDSLETTDKTIVGAINEVNATIGSDNSILGTWVFNDELNFDGLELNKEYTINFTAIYDTEEQLTNIKVEDNDGVLILQYGAPRSYMGGALGYSNVYTSEFYGGIQGWYTDSYKTITITEEPTDETFITWLRANATKQSETIFDRLDNLEAKVVVPQTPITYSELVTLRDNSELIPGQFYRITDYQCTTVQESTRAMNNQFDIIVQALSSNTLSEIAKADYHLNEDGTPDGYFMKSTSGQILNITWYYTITRGRYEANTAFGDLGHEENNEGITVPVLYRMDGEEVNYTDKYFYIDTYEYDDMQCSRWRLIEGGEYTGSAESGLHDWENDTNRKYVLTNLVVEDGEFTIEDASEVETLYTIYDDDEGSYAKEEDNHNDTIVETGYKENNEGVIVPVLYKNDLDNYTETDYGDVLYYVGRYEYLGEAYDRWRKIEDEEWNDTYRYILTSIAVDENGQFLNSVFPDDVTVEKVKVANLPAWELKYCLDNDTTRFAWADEENGKGVIWYMKDEHNNECPYDFKNIQFIRPLSFEWGHPEYDPESGEDTWVYTFCGKECDEESGEWSELKDGSLESPYGHQSDNVNDLHSFSDNIIKPFISGYDNNNEDPTKIGVMRLNNIVMLGFWNKRNLNLGTYSYFYGCKATVFSNNCFDNTLGHNCSHNKFGNNCNSNIFGNSCQNNTFISDCHNNIFGNSCFSNTLGEACINNTFGNGCSRNTFVAYCWVNTFGGNCSSNTFGGGCRDNTFGDNCTNNVFDNGCSSNTFGDGCNFNTFSNDCSYNTFGASCESNVFGDYCQHDTFGNSETNTISHVRYIRFENDCQYIRLRNSETGDHSNYIQNITVSAGISGAFNASLNLQVSRNAPPVVYEAAGTTHIILD